MTQQLLIRTQQYTVVRLSSTAFTVFAAVKPGAAYNNFLRTDNNDSKEAPSLPIHERSSGYGQTTTALHGVSRNQG